MESEGMVLNYTKDDAVSILCQAMFDETLRLRTKSQTIERDSIRRFLTESAAILLESTSNMQNQEKHSGDKRPENLQPNMLD